MCRKCDSTKATTNQQLFKVKDLMNKIKSDIEIARAANLYIKPIDKLDRLLNLMYLRKKNHQK